MEGPVWANGRRTHWSIGWNEARGVFWAALIVKAPRALGLFISQGAGAGAFLGDL
jgi:hypothetical protein